MFVVALGRTRRNSAKPAQVSTSHTMVRRGGHRRSRPARIKTAKTMPLTITGCTRARSPRLSATACRPNAIALSARPVSHDGRRTRRAMKPVLDSLEAEDSPATRCCSAEPPAKQAAEANAATTANSTDPPPPPDQCQPRHATFAARPQVGTRASVLRCDNPQQTTSMVTPLSERGAPPMFPAEGASNRWPSPDQRATDYERVLLDGLTALRRVLGSCGARCGF